jgi:hypothetical protein
LFRNKLFGRQFLDHQRRIKLILKDLNVDENYENNAIQNLQQLQEEQERAIKIQSEKKKKLTAQIITELIENINNQDLEKKSQILLKKLNQLKQLLNDSNSDIQSENLCNQNQLKELQNQLISHDNTKKLLKELSCEKYEKLNQLESLLKQLQTKNNQSKSDISILQKLLKQSPKNKNLIKYILQIIERIKAINTQKEEKFIKLQELLHQMHNDQNLSKNAESQDLVNTKQATQKNIHKKDQNILKNLKESPYQFLYSNTQNLSLASANQNQDQSNPLTSNVAQNQEGSNQNQGLKPQGQGSNSDNEGQQQGPEIQQQDPGVQRQGSLDKLKDPTDQNQDQQNKVPQGILGKEKQCKTDISATRQNLAATQNPMILHESNNTESKKNTKNTSISKDIYKNFKLIILFICIIILCIFISN